MYLLLSKSLVYYSYSLFNIFIHPILYYYLVFIIFLNIVESCQFVDITFLYNSHFSKQVLVIVITIELFWHIGYFVNALEHSSTLELSVRKRFWLI